MREKPSNERRARDDRHLRRLVSETREWMQAEGIEDRPLDWKAIARDEAARWWRARLQEALTDLAARSREFAEPLASRLRQLAAAAESQAEAALEVSFEAAQQVGCVIFEPVQACLRPGATLQFTRASVAVRSKLGLGAGQEESVGIFISSTIPGARVIADALRQTITVEFWEPPSPPLVMLVAEDPALAPRLDEASLTDDTAQVRFDEVSPGRYLLAMYVQEEAET